MPRERLPDRRHSLLIDLEYQGTRYDLCIGLKPDGDPGEIFITGTAAEVTPVTEIGDRSFTVGDITRTLMEDYHAVVHNGGLGLSADAAE